MGPAIANLENSKHQPKSLVFNKYEFSRRTTLIALSLNHLEDFDRRIVPRKYFVRLDID